MTSDTVRKTSIGIVSEKFLLIMWCNSAAIRISGVWIRTNMQVHLIINATCIKPLKAKHHQPLRVTSSKYLQHLPVQPTKRFILQIHQEQRQPRVCSPAPQSVKYIKLFVHLQSCSWFKLGQKTKKTAHYYHYYEKLVKHFL